MLTNIIYHQPENIKKFMVDMLKRAKMDENGHLKLGTQFLKKEDYESMFDSYDFQRTGVIPYGNLIKGS